MHKTLASILTTLATFFAMAHGDSPQVVPISAQSLRAVPASIGESVKGLYRMSDGRWMKVWHRGSTVIADLDDEPPARLRFAGNGVLQSEDGRMVLRQTGVADSLTSDVAVTLFRGERMAVLEARR